MNRDYSADSCVYRWTSDRESEAIRAEHERGLRLVGDWRASEEGRRDGKRSALLWWLVTGALVGIFLALAALFGAA